MPCALCPERVKLKTYRTVRRAVVVITMDHGWEDPRFCFVPEQRTSGRACRGSAKARVSYRVVSYRIVSLSYRIGVDPASSLRPQGGSDPRPPQQSFVRPSVHRVSSRRRAWYPVAPPSLLHSRCMCVLCHGLRARARVCGCVWVWVSDASDGFRVVVVSADFVFTVIKSWRVGAIY